MSNSNIEPPDLSKIRNYFEELHSLLQPEQLEELKKNLNFRSTILKSIDFGLPPLQFHPAPDRQELSPPLASLEPFRYASESAQRVTEKMRQSIEELNREIAKKGAYRLLLTRLCLLSGLPRRVIEEKFREYCQTHPEKSPEDNFEDVKGNLTYLKWDVVNKNCKFFSGDEKLKCAVNPTISCFNCQKFEERRCKFFSGSAYLKCAVNPTAECSECPHFEE
jgi:hypothetical protein